MPASAKRNVVAAIIEDGEGRVLLAQRPPGKSLEGLWEFPGGKVEENETLEQAIARELKEELHLEIQILKYLGPFDHTYSSGEICLHVFVVRPLNAPRRSQDVEVFEWVPAGEVRNFNLAPADIEPWSCHMASRPSAETV